MTLQQFQSSKVKIPWLTHCAIWGIALDHEDSNQRVISYWNGYHIFENYFKDGKKHYEVIIGNTDEVFETLEEAEMYLWNDFVRYQEIDQFIGLYTEDLDTVVTKYFKKVLTTENCSGDITPDQKIIYDKALENIATILFEMVCDNKIPKNETNTAKI